jgi:CxxC-x17-CxxC domain-containing protein
MADWKRAGGFGGKKGGGGGDFKRGGFGKPRFGGGFKKDFGGQGGRGGEDREMFDAVCSSCGNDCQVPFKPNGSAPVLCRDCFQKQKDSEGGAPRRDSRGDDRGFRGGDDRRSEKPRFDTRTSFKDGRPEFTPRGGNATPDPRIDSLVSEMQGMNAKLEKLVLLMGTMVRDGAMATKTDTAPTSEVLEVKAKKAPKAAAKKKKK